MRVPFGISCPTQIRFGPGVSAELETFLPDHAKRVLLLRGAGGAAVAPVRALLKTLDLVEVSAGGEPSVTSVNAVLDQVDGPVDAVIACGGGAVLDTGKAVTFCLNHGLRLTDAFGDIDPRLLAVPGAVPLIALPTTAGTGAEVTANAVLDVASQKAKISLRGRGLFPSVALVDPALMMSAPDAVVLHAGLDAVTQIIEAFTSNAATAFSDALTIPALPTGLFALRRVIEDRAQNAMTDMAWTALSSGLALANGGLGAAHGAASVLGGQYGAPHGALCGRLLMPVLRQNLAAAVAGSEAHQRIDTCCAAIAAVFTPLPGGDDLSGLEDWVKRHGLPRLGAYGVTPDALDSLAERSMFASSSRKNAVDLAKADYVAMLTQAM
jgi:alcohol dehydrogenase class IV